MGPAPGPATSELEQARTAPEFGSHTPLAEKLLAVAIRAQNFTGSSGVAIALTEGQDMVCRASWGTSAPEVGAKLSVEHSFTGLCVRTREPLRCDDAQSDPRVDPEACRALGISAIAVAPVRRGLKVVGVIAAFSDTPNAFTDKHLLILTTLSEVIIELLDEGQAPAGQAAAQTAAVLEPVALLDPAVAASEGVESVAVFEDQPLSPAKVPNAAAEPRKTPTGTKELQSGSPVIVPPPRQSSAIPAGPASTEDVADLFEIPRKKKDGIAPEPVEHDRSAKAGTSSSVRLVPLRQPATDSVPELTFSSYESLEGPPRRWWLVAAVLILLALIAWGAWRWHAARSARMAAATASAPLVSPSASATQPSQAPDFKPLESTPSETKAETKRSAFTPASTAPPSAKAAAASEAPDDVTIRRVPEAVIEADAPVRRPAASGKPRAAAQVPEAQAPQLALSSPELPSVLGKPAPAAIAAPVSHMIPAQLVTRVPPAYPEAARRLNMSGKVVLKATITRTGSVGNLEWVSGNELFRPGALAAVKQWRYKPSTLNGQPVDSDLQIVLQFKPQTGQ